MNEVTRWLDLIDPAGTARKAFTESGFALPKLYADRIRALPSMLAPSRLAQSLPANGVNLAPLAGRKVADVADTLGQSNVSYVERQVTSRADVPVRAAAPVIAPGSKVIVYTDGTKILDIQPYAVEQQLADHVQQIQDLQSQIARLHTTVEAMRVPSTATGKE